MTNNTQLQSYDKDQLATLKNMLEKNISALSQVVPKHMTPDRLIKLANVAASRNKRLLDCTPISILTALMDAGSLGLEPFTALQQSYIIPYKNFKTNVMEAQFQVGYRGLIDLARRSDKIISIEAHTVHLHDTFDCELGLDSKIVHKPNWLKDRGAIIAVYAVAKMRDDGVQFDIMSKTDIDAVRKTSKSANNGPWVDFYGEMAKKTIVKRLMKYLPLTIELQRAVAIDNKSDSEIETDFIDVSDSQELLSEVVTVEDIPSSKKIEAMNHVEKMRADIIALIDLHVPAGQNKDAILKRTKESKDVEALDRVNSVVAAYVKRSEKKDVAE